ncbi:MAG: TlpA disulfide reductase family protein [Deltaproteobacteria bacterium]|jgi:peroxiredoxin
MKKSHAARVLLTGLLLLTAMTFGCEKRPPAKAKVATVGQPAPDFILSDLHGKKWRLSDLRGKEVFLNFWATWCPPCRGEMPDMEALHREMTLTAQPFQMIAVLSNDDPRRAAGFARKLNLTFPILVDEEGKAGAEYGITGVPETYIIDAHGILRAKFIGPRPWNSPGAKELLRRYLPRPN